MAIKAALRYVDVQKISTTSSVWQPLLPMAVNKHPWMIWVPMSEDFWAPLISIGEKSSYCRVWRSLRLLKENWELSCSHNPYSLTSSSVPLQNPSGNLITVLFSFHFRITAPLRSSSLISTDERTDCVRSFALFGNGERCLMHCMGSYDQR